MSEAMDPGAEAPEVPLKGETAPAPLFFTAVGRYAGGGRAEWTRFFTAINRAMDLYALRYNREAIAEAAVLEAMLHLEGPAADEAIKYEEILGRVPTMEELRDRLYQVFIPDGNDKVVRRALGSLRQGGRALEDHIGEFRRIVSQAKIEEAQLICFFEESLDQPLGQLVATHPSSSSLEGAISVALQMSRFAPPPRPIQVNAARGLVRRPPDPRRRGRPCDSVKGSALYARPRSILPVSAL